MNLFSELIYLVCQLDRMICSDSVIGYFMDLEYPTVLFMIVFLGALVRSSKNKIYVLNNLLQVCFAINIFEQHSRVCK